MIRSSVHLQPAFHAAACAPAICATSPCPPARRRARRSPGTSSLPRRIAAAPRDTRAAAARWRLGCVAADLLSSEYFPACTDQVAEDLLRPLPQPTHGPPSIANLRTC